MVTYENNDVCHVEEFVISIRDINFGQHLDHLALLGYLHETRFRYFKKIGYTEIDVDGAGHALLVVSLTCNYKKECYYGELITVTMKMRVLSALKLILVYQVERSGVIVATSEITVAFINVDTHKIVKIPSNIFGK